MVCPRHGANGGSAIDIYDWRNCDTNQSCILWVDQNVGRILCQTSTTTSSFRGSFLEEEPHPRAGVVLRIAFHPRGDGSQIETYVVMKTSNDLFVGLDGQGRNVEMRWRRKMQMCGYCGYCADGDPQFRRRHYLRHGHMPMGQTPLCRPFTVPQSN